MANNITIELCTEDRARIDKLIAALELRTTQVNDIVSKGCLYASEEEIQNAYHGAESKAEQAEDTQAEQTPTQTTDDATAASTAATEHGAERPQVSVEDIRSKYMSLATTPKKEDARQLIKQYADKITDIPEDKMAEVLKKLTELEAKA